MSRRVVVAVALTACLAGACDGEPVAYGVAGSEVRPYDLALDTSDLGLAFEREDVADRLEVVEETYAEALSVYSLRRDDLVQATLQATDLNPAADVGSEQFRTTLVATLGNRVPRPIRVGQTQVWLTVGTEQTLAAWFHEDRFFVLAVRAEYEEPRRLLRRMTEATA